MHEWVARSRLSSRLYATSGVELESCILRNKVYWQSRNYSSDDNVMCFLNAATGLLYVVQWSSEIREIAYCLWVSSIFYCRSIESLLRSFMARGSRSGLQVCKHHVVTVGKTESKVRPFYKKWVFRCKFKARPASKFEQRQKPVSRYKHDWSNNVRHYMHNHDKKCAWFGEWSKSVFYYELITLEKCIMF